jgi:hypothetical protein
MRYTLQSWKTRFTHSKCMDVGPVISVSNVALLKFLQFLRIGTTFHEKKSELRIHNAFFPYYGTFFRNLGPQNLQSDYFTSFKKFGMQFVSFRKFEKSIKFANCVRSEILLRSEK